MNKTPANNQELAIEDVLIPHSELSDEDLQLVSRGLKVRVNYTDQGSDDSAH